MSTRRWCCAWAPSTGVGHARLILERFGKFWGAFSVIDLFILNALTIVTEFIGISLGLDYLGLPKLGRRVGRRPDHGRGRHRRLPPVRALLAWCWCWAACCWFRSVFMVHPPMGAGRTHFVVPQLPSDAPLSDVMLLIIAIVGTTVAPWQLFFQQSYVIDKRITPRFIRYERIDLWLGIVLVIVGAVAIIAFCAQAFAGTAGSRAVHRCRRRRVGLGEIRGRLPGVLFAIALIDASIIGAAAISLVLRLCDRRRAVDASTRCTASRAKPRAFTRSIAG